jgi:predicted TIM-barrel fold metal-dependent hydrolase
MRAFDTLLDHIHSLWILDTHEHLPTEAQRPADTDVLAEWLIHYASDDLRSAGLSAEGLAEARDSKKDLIQRWRLVAPHWHAAESTGYLRALALSARELYGIERINEKTIGDLNERFCAARRQGGWYDFVLKTKSKIALAIRSPYWAPEADCPDPFVFTFLVDPFIIPTHHLAMAAKGQEVGVRVHTLEDWKEVTRRCIQRDLHPRSRIVCMKCGLAYQRSLRFDKVSEDQAQRDFTEFFRDGNMGDWRPAIKAPKAFSDHMQHFICKVADEMGLVYQFHTGIHAGNGNFIYDSNPALLSNLFLEYTNVKFDLFHISYPYVGELSTLAKIFPNVFIDMCWGHIISPELSRRALVEWLDAVPANKISAFGGDYCFVDGVYGHQLLARQNVAAALAQKVEDGSFDLARAQEIATWLFVDNPRRLFALDRFLKPGKKGSGPRRSKRA